MFTVGIFWQLTVGSGVLSGFAPSVYWLNDVLAVHDDRQRVRKNLDPSLLAIFNLAGVDNSRHFGRSQSDDRLCGSRLGILCRDFSPRLNHDRISGSVEARGAGVHIRRGRFLWQGYFCWRGVEPSGSSF